MAKTAAYGAYPSLGPLCPGYHGFFVFRRHAVKARWGYSALYFCGMDYCRRIGCKKTKKTIAENCRITRRLAVGPFLHFRPHFPGHCGKFHCRRGKRNRHFLRNKRVHYRSHGCSHRYFHARTSDNDRCQVARS